MSDSDSAGIQTPKFNNFLNNSAGWLNDTLHGTGTGDSVTTDIQNVTDPLNITHAPAGAGTETAAKDQAAKDQVNQDQNNAAVAQVTQELQDNRGSIDLTTSNEIQAALAKGDSGTAAKLLQQAKAGTGIYGVRETNEKQRQLLAVYPGRAQLSPRYNLINEKAGA